MDNRWHRAAGGWFGQDSEPGTTTLFWNWDLLDWTFGIRFENDPSWRDVHFHFGPISFDLCRWRKHPMDMWFNAEVTYRKSGRSIVATDTAFMDEDQK